MELFCDSEFGRLRSVAVARPTFYRETSPINLRQEREYRKHPIRRDVLEKEHEAVVHTLRDMGVGVVEIEPHPDMPYLLNMRDAAVVAGDALLPCQMNRSIRRPEPQWVLSQLGIDNVAASSQLESCSIEGGDIFQIGDQLIVGKSQRTTRKGALQLLGSLDRSLRLVGLNDDVLHLDTVFNVVGRCAILAPSHVQEPQEFLRLLEAIGIDWVIRLTDDESDDLASNFLCLDSAHVLMSDTAPRLQGELNARGVATTTVSMSEHHRIGGSVRCMTLVLSRDPFHKERVGEQFKSPTEPES